MRDHCGRVRDTERHAEEAEIKLADIRKRLESAAGADGCVRIGTIRELLV